MFLTARSSTSYDTFALNEMDSFTWKGYSIVDVREPDEYDIGHIPGAINVPLSVLYQGNFTLLHKDANYIIIYHSGNGPQTAIEILYYKGYSIVNISHGMSS